MRSADSFIPLTRLSTEVLLALLEGQQHGYGLIKAIEARTDGRLSPGAGSLYAALDRMLEDGLLREAKGVAGADARRRYYAITPLGRAVLAAEVNCLKALVRVAVSRLSADLS